MKNAMKFLYILIITNLSFYSIGQNIIPEWVLTYGGTFIDQAKCVEVDNNNDVIMLGYFGDSVDFDPAVSNSFFEAKGWIDLVIQKVDASGNVQWTKSIGNDVGGSTIGMDMITDLNGNIYIAGVFSDSVDFDPGVGLSYKSSNGGEDIFILKLDVNGGFVWVKTFGSSVSEKVFSIAKDLNNNLLIAGNFIGACDFDPGVGTFTLTSQTSDAYVLKLNSDGNFVWVKSIGGTGYTAGYEISTDLNQNVFLAGNFSDTTDFDPGVGVYDISVNGTNSDAYVLKLDSSGTFLWVNHYGEDIRNLENDSFGNVLLYGTFVGLVDFDNLGGNDTISSIGYSGFVQKLDPNGNNLWVKAIQTDESIIAGDLHLSSNNDIYITGGFYGVTDFDPSSNAQFIDSAVDGKDAFILKISNNGEFLWQKSLKGIQGELGRSISTDNDGGVYIAGYFQYDCDFEGGVGVINSQGENDMFLMKIGGTASMNEPESLSSTIKAFPNPTSGKLIVRFDKLIDSELFIYNLEGQVLDSKQINELVTVIDFTNYETGIYRLQIVNNEETKIINIVKQ